MKLSIFRSKSNSSKKGSISPTRRGSSLRPGSYQSSTAASPTRSKVNLHGDNERAPLTGSPQRTGLYSGSNFDVPEGFDPLSQGRDLSELPGLPTSDVLFPLNQDVASRPQLVNRSSSRVSIERPMPRVSADGIASSSPLPARYSKKDQREGDWEAAEPRDIPRVSSRLSVISPKLHWPLNMLPRTSLGSNTPLNFAGSPPRNSPERPGEYQTEAHHATSETSRIMEEDEVDYGDSPLTQSLQDSPSVIVAQRYQSYAPNTNPTSTYTFDGTSQSVPWRDAPSSIGPKTTLPQFTTSHIAPRADSRISRAQVSAPRVEQQAARGEFVSPGGSSEFVSAAEAPRTSSFTRSVSQSRNYSSPLGKHFPSSIASDLAQGQSSWFVQALPTNAVKNLHNYESNRSIAPSPIFSSDVVHPELPRETLNETLIAEHDPAHSHHHLMRYDSFGPLTPLEDAEPGAIEAEEVKATERDEAEIIEIGQEDAAEGQDAVIIEEEDKESAPAPSVVPSKRPSGLRNFSHTYRSSSAILSRPDNSRTADTDQLFSSSQYADAARPNGGFEEPLDISTMESTAFYTASSFNSSTSAFRSLRSNAYGNSHNIDTVVVKSQVPSANGSKENGNVLVGSSTSRHDDQERPRYFKNQSVSFSSVVSSNLNNGSQDDSDNAADYGLQTGGASSRAMSNQSRPGRELSRLPSFASTRSERTETESLRRRKRSLSPLPLPSSESNGERHDMVDESLLVTPKAKVRPSDDGPTDTVLARHVRDVEVPNTVAKEYRAMHLPSSEADPSLNSTPYYTQGKASLTLKEQNSKMDKLSKENFDLKLKIHYLHQALQDRSEEGVKDLISKNVQLQADLIKAKKEIQSLKKRIRELERSERVNDEDMSASRSTITVSETDASTRSYRQAQLEEEILYLRTSMQNLDQENQQLKNDRLQDTHPSAVRDLLADETNRRKQLEVGFQTLQEENRRLADARLHARNLTGNQTRSQVSGSSDDRNDLDSLSGTTLVEQLKQQNAELRRDLGAQTSMLSSRNRERERLQQEIEDLKIYQRHSISGQSTSGDSILDRSVSRANYTPALRMRGPQLGDAERDQHEFVQAELRDENAAFRIRIQELQRSLQRAGTQADIQAMQAERDQVLLDLDSLETQAEEELRRAASEIDDLDAIVLQKERDISQLSSDLRRRELESSNLQREVRAITESLNRVVDDCENSQSTIQHLQKELIDANGELDAMEEKIHELNDAKARLEVQQESSQGEIAFLRDEQDGDKIKIGDLESAVRVARGSIHTKTFKQEEFDELQTSMQQARDEVRALRKKLSTTEREATVSKHNLESVESSLREVFNSEASGPGLLSDVFKLKRDLEYNLQVLGDLELRLGEKDRLIKDRDALLESSGLESLRLSDLLDKERQARKHEHNESERTRKLSGTPDKRLAEIEKTRSQEKKHFASLEHRLNGQIRETHSLLLGVWTEVTKLCSRDWQAQHRLDDPMVAESIAMDPAAFEDRIHSALSNITSNHANVRTRIRSTEQDLLKSLSVLSRTLDARTRRIDALERNFAAHAKDSTETQEQALAELSRLEDDNKALRDQLAETKAAVDASSAAGRASSSRSPEHDRSRSRISRSSSAAGHLVRRGDSNTSTTSALRHHHQNLDHPSNTTLSTHHHNPDAPTATAAAATAFSRTTPAPSASDQRWIMRLREMETRLRKEREGRLLDREGARKRLEEGRREVEALKGELGREKDRAVVVVGAGRG